VKINHVVIMAAGRGQRMMPLTQHTAKPMAPYLDTTLIGHGIAKVKQQVPNVHVTVGYRGGEVGRYVIDMGISSVVNTAGHSNSWWIHNSVLGYLDEPTLVLTCDNVTDINLPELEIDYFRRGQPLCMLVPARPVEGLAGDYIFHDTPGYVSKISRTEPTDVYCSGIQIINPARVKALTWRSADFYDVWRELINHWALQVSSVFPTKWTAIDTVADLDRANKEAP